MPPRRGAPGGRAAALIALVLGLARLRPSRQAGWPCRLLPRTFSAGQREQIESWEIASRWQEVQARQLFPERVSYQLSATVLEDTMPLNLAAERIGIAPQSGCGAGVTTTAAASVLRADGCTAVPVGHLHGLDRELRHDRRRGRAAQRRGRGQGGPEPVRLRLTSAHTTAAAELAARPPGGQVSRQRGSGV